MPQHLAWDHPSKLAGENHDIPHEIYGASSLGLIEVDFQFLVDKVADEIPPLVGNNITTIGRMALVKSVLSAQAVYYITPLIVPR